MAAPKGNQFWKARSKHGRDKLFASADALWEACQEYFEWVDANPLMEEKGFAFQGVVTKESFNKMRAMTLDGLYIFLDIDESTWRDWREQEDFSRITTTVEKIIRTQKLTGAAADLLNPNIIARELGLRDAQDVKHSGLIRTSDMDDDELDRLIRERQQALEKAQRD